MTDAEIALALKITVDEVRRLTRRDRATYERLLLTELAMKMWLEGRGERPKGVIICDARVRRRAS